MTALRTFRTEKEMLATHAEERALMRGDPKSMQGLTMKVCMECGVFIHELLGPMRYRELVRIRHSLWHHLHKRAGYSLSEIGAYFNRDHTTILHGVQKIEKGLNK